MRLTVHAPTAIEDVRHGDSIAVSGVCLTVVDWTARGVHRRRDEADPRHVDARRRSTPGRHVNVERALASGGRLGGHIVQGHIDGTGEVLDVRPGDKWQVVRVGIPADIAPLVVDKGSITLDGTSLTISAVSAPGRSLARGSRSP